MSFAHYSIYVHVLNGDTRDSVKFYIFIFKCAIRDNTFLSAPEPWQTHTHMTITYGRKKVAHYLLENKILMQSSTTGHFVNVIMVYFIDTMSERCQLNSGYLGDCSFQLLYWK